MAGDGISDTVLSGRVAEVFRHLPLILLHKFGLGRSCPWLKP